jgi:hypothetical protein
MTEQKKKRGRPSAADKAAAEAAKIKEALRQFGLEEMPSAEEAELELLRRVLARRTTERLLLGTDLKAADLMSATRLLTASGAALDLTDKTRREAHQRAIDESMDDDTDYSPPDDLPTFNDPTPEAPAGE